MRAIIKNSKKIVINQIDPSERALIDDFVRKSYKKNTIIRSLYDIDNELDGASFELSGSKSGIVDFKTPCIQVIAMNGTVIVDLKLNDDVIITFDPEENREYLDIAIENNLISITGKSIEEFIGTTKQYIVTLTLEEPEHETTIVPINVSVLYITSSIGNNNYEELRNLPKLNHVKIIGDKGLDEFGIQEEIGDITNSDIDDLF